MTSRNETYKLIANAMLDKMPKSDELQVAQDREKLYIRLTNQVFTIEVDELVQFNNLGDEEAIKATKNFMDKLPFPYTKK
ncbi:hypothetical protein [Mesorhizobium sp. B1-1-7]|uniref:hypothetical protein n=1 Tax=Mesorhizobium sp. B1-1-7 TaxID=2589977 RepID=UPI00112837F5|nr:hypothetical protein [Mesorhizobium sp. B1-1-7]TPN48567.1 hypothetical protein FJ978_19535 [Mesorhizobium sp. B1-1-7]